MKDCLVVTGRPEAQYWRSYVLAADGVSQARPSLGWALLCLVQVAWHKAGQVWCGVMPCQMGGACLVTEDSVGVR
jgi:hypothetical protein